MYEVRGLVCDWRDGKQENTIVRVDTYQRTVTVLDGRTEQELTSFKWADIELAEPYFQWLKISLKKGSLSLRLAETRAVVDEVNKEDEIYGLHKSLWDLGAVLRSVITRHEAPISFFRHIFKQLCPYTDCSDMDQHMDAIAAARQLADAPAPARTLTVPRHGSGELFADMRNNGTLSDVTVVVDARDGEAAVRLRAHKLVLAAHSPVLRAMFTGDTQEANNGEVRLDMRPSVGRAVVDICYSGKAVVSTDAAIDLLMAADMLGMEALAGVVAEWLLPAIRPVNVLEMWIAATRVRQPHLIDKCSNLAFYFIEFCGDARAPLLAHLRECTADQLTDVLSAAVRERLSATRIRTLIDTWAAQQAGRADAAREMLSLLVDYDFERRDLQAILRDLRDWPTVEGAIKCCQELLRLVDGSSEGEGVEEEKTVARAADLCFMADNHLHLVLRKLMRHEDATLDALSLRLLAALAAGRWIPVEFIQDLDAFLCSCVCGAPELSEAALYLLASLSSLPSRPALSDELNKALLALLDLLALADASAEPRLAHVCDAIEAVGCKMSCAAVLPLFAHRSTRVRLLACRLSPTFSRVRRQNRCAIVLGLSSLLSDAALRAPAARALYDLSDRGDGTWPIELFLAGDLCAFSLLSNALGSLAMEDDPPADSKATVSRICEMLVAVLNDDDVANPVINKVFVERHALIQMFALCSKEWVRGASAEEGSLPRAVLGVVCGALERGDDAGATAARLVSTREHAVALMLTVLCHDRTSGAVSPLAHSIVHHLNALIRHEEYGKSVIDLLRGSEWRVLDEMARHNESADCGYTKDLLKECKQLVDVLNGAADGRKRRKRKA